MDAVNPMRQDVCVTTPREYFKTERQFADWVLADLQRLASAGIGSLEAGRAEVTAASGSRVDVLACTPEQDSVVVELFLDACDRDHAARLLHYRAEHQAKHAVIVAAAYSKREWDVLQNENDALKAGGRAIHVLEVAIVDGTPTLRSATGPVDVATLRRLAAIKANETRGREGRSKAARKAVATRKAANG